VNFVWNIVAVRENSKFLFIRAEVGKINCKTVDTK